MKIKKSFLKKLIRECVMEIIREEEQPEAYDDRTNTVAPGPRQRPEDWQPGGDTSEKLPVVNRPLSEVGATKPEKLLNGERTKIGKEFAKMGLDGNGRFESISKGLNAITNTLSTLGFNLDMVSSDMIMGDKGSRNLLFRRTNDTGQDIFTEKPTIENSRITFAWENLAAVGNSPRYEILAYAS